MANTYSLTSNVSPHDSDRSEAARVAELAGIPPCPDVLTAVMQEADRPVPDIAALSRMIAGEGELARAMLHAVNSPLHGHHNKAADVESAVSAIGPRCAANLLARLCLTRMLRGLHIAAVTRYWELASQLSMVVAYLARELGVCDFETGQTFGLFRNGGVGLLLARYPTYRAFLTATRDEVADSVAQREQLLFGVDHAAAGAALARSWCLSDRLWLPIRLQLIRDPLPQEPAHSDALRLVAAGVLADCLDRSRLGLDVSSEWAQEEAFARHVLEVRHDTLATLRTDVALMLGGS